MRIRGTNNHGKFTAERHGSYWTVSVSGLYEATFTMTEEQVRTMVLTCLGLGDK